MFVEKSHVRVVERTRGDRLDPLALVDRLGELRRRQGRDLVVVAVAEDGCGRFGLGEIDLDARVVAGGVEVGEVPRDLFGTGLLDGCHGLETR